MLVGIVWVELEESLHCWYKGVKSDGRLIHARTDLDVDILAMIEVYIRA